eukprot:6822333-Heterocapsa_arctica.AAC.1
MHWDCTRRCRRLTAAQYLELLGAALPYVQEALSNGCLHLSWVEVVTCHKLLQAAARPASAGGTPLHRTPRSRPPPPDPGGTPRS